MKIFIDTGDIDEIREAHALGLVDGVTTNPSLVAATGKPFKELLQEICAVVKGPVSAEVSSLEAGAMLDEGRALAAIHKNIVVQVPLVAEGLKATRQFTREGIKTNVTLCFSATQALLAAKAGATYVSPFVGRLEDISQEGMALIEDIRTIYDNYGFETDILTAGARSPTHFVQAAKIGSDAITAPFKVLLQILEHPLTKSGLEKFLADHEKAEAVPPLTAVAGKKK